MMWIHTDKINGGKTDLVPSGVCTEVPWATSNLGAYQRKSKTNHDDIMHVIEVQSGPWCFYLVLLKQIPACLEINCAT